MVYSQQFATSTSEKMRDKILNFNSIIPAPERGNSHPPSPFLWGFYFALFLERVDGE